LFFCFCFFVFQLNTRTTVFQSRGLAMVMASNYYLSSPSSRCYFVLEGPCLSMFLTLSGFVFVFSCCLFVCYCGCFISVFFCSYTKLDPHLEVVLSSPSPRPPIWSQHDPICLFSCLLSELWWHNNKWFVHFDIFRKCIEPKWWFFNSKEEHTVTSSL